MTAEECARVALVLNIHVIGLTAIRLNVLPCVDTIANIFFQIETHLLLLRNGAMEFENSTQNPNLVSLSISHKDLRKNFIAN